MGPEIRGIEIDENCLELIEKVIINAPQNKAVGPDEIFVEALAINRTMSSKIFGTLWRKCSEMNYLPADWATEIMVLTFEKGSASNPEAYGPIALLSQLRKIVDAATAMRIREAYSFGDE